MSRKVKAARSFMGRYGGKFASQTPSERHADVQSWLGKADAADAAGLSRERMLRGTTTGSASSESARYQDKLRQMASTTGGTRTSTVGKREYYSAKMRESAARGRRGANPRRGGTAPGPTPPPASGSAANAGATPPPPPPSSGSTANAGASGGPGGFFEATQASGVGQHLGMVLAGGVSGGVGAWVTGGSVMQGAMFGGAVGGLAGAKNRDLWGGAQSARMGAHKAMIGRARTSLAAAKKSGDETAIKAARKHLATRRAAGMSARQNSIGVQNAAATSAGFGLASGVMFSGHKRKNVNQNNAYRGNYIGR